MAIEQSKKGEAGTEKFLERIQNGDPKALEILKAAQHQEGLGNQKETVDIKLPDSGGSKIETVPTEKDIFEATNKHIVDPKIMSPDDSSTAVALKNHIEETSFIDSSGNPKLDLKDFLDNLQNNRD